MKEIQLTQGKVALVDDEDYARVLQFKWNAITDRYNWYARRTVHRKHQYLHRFILNDPKGRVDHRNGNGLDNQKLNLRVATASQNSYNSRSRKNSSSQYKGVSWSNHNRKWRAQIDYQGKDYHLGYFEAEQEAAEQYNIAASWLQKEFARPNIIRPALISAHVQPINLPSVMTHISGSSQVLSGQEFSVT